MAQSQQNTIAIDEIILTLENTLTTLWLPLLHPGLPQLVKQKYGSDLHNKTVASIKEKTLQAVHPLLD